MPENQETTISEMKEHVCISSLKFKEEDVYEALVASTHPDRVGDILSLHALHQIADYINTTTQVGDQQGAYRSVSLAHDWIKESNPELDEVGFLQPDAKVVELEDGNFGVKVSMKLNKFYRGNQSIEEIDFRIKNGHYAGLSIEYDTDKSGTKPVNHQGKVYRFIEKLSKFGGVGLARARMIANPFAIIYKEIAAQVGEIPKEEEAQLEHTECSLSELDSESDILNTKKMENTITNTIVTETVTAPAVVAEVKETPVVVEQPKLNIKEVLESKEFKDAVMATVQVPKEVLKVKEEIKMDNKVSLSIKEMNEAMSAKEFDSFKYKEASRAYFENFDAEIKEKLNSTGIPLKSNLQVKCDGNKLRIVGNFQIKDTLASDSNANSYTQTSVEFADLYLPGIIDTFNNQTNLFGALRKVEHLAGSDKYGWTIKTLQRSGASVDPDSTSINKDYMRKLKLQTPIKEYRLGVSVNDFTLYHSRASMGDLFRVEVESAMKDLMLDLNTDLFTEQADGAGNKILGLEAVADSAGNTTLYGLTRSSTNRLAPDSAADTYQAVGGALTTALLREARRKVEVEGAQAGNLRYVVNPVQRDKLYELMDDNQRFAGVMPQFGFQANGAIQYDGIPFIVDFKCQSDAVYVIDLESAYIVVSRAPQLVGLAKIGAAQEAFISTYLAFVYEQPRRIHMKDTLTT